MDTGVVQITRNGKAAFPHSRVSFEERLGGRLRSTGLGTLQVNVGKLCNQACKHCHVDASPKRTEIMSRATVDEVLRVLREFRIPILDITGGAPELNPSFRYLVEESRSLVSKILVRHNLTVMFEDGQSDLPDFFARNGVEVISSLPYFLQQQTDAQRGTGVFEKSVEALRRLNQAEYGVDESLILNLVYNPVGAFLPPAQASIEADFRREMMVRYGISFTNLYTITNMPIARFLDWLRRSGNEDEYMQKLVNSFNPATVSGLMCRDMISVDWKGRLYDCDFNQMLALGLDSGLPRTITGFELDKLENRPIVTADHCFGCTAGSGSSCGGSVTV